MNPENWSIRRQSFRHRVSRLGEADPCGISSSRERAISARPRQPCRSRIARLAHGVRLGSIAGMGATAEKRREFAMLARDDSARRADRPASPLSNLDAQAAREARANQTEEVMSKLPATLPAATAVLLLAFAGGCATKQDVDALRADVATKGEVQALHADVAGLRGPIEALAAARATATRAAPPAEYQELRSEIAALRTSIEAAGKTPGADTAATQAGPPTRPPPPRGPKIKTPAEAPGILPRPRAPP